MRGNTASGAACPTNLRGFVLYAKNEKNQYLISD